MSSDLKDLLGSDDESEGINSPSREEKSDPLFDEPPVVASASKKEQIPVDVNNYLGSSDDEEAEMEVENYPASQHSRVSHNELDKIFGETEEGIISKQQLKKSKIASKLVLPNSFKINPNSKTVFLRTPNFVKISTKLYESSLYQPEEEKKEFDSATSVIRHRLASDGNTVESNARLIQWSDGSQQLVVGDAVFDMKSVPTDNWYANCFVFRVFFLILLLFTCCVCVFASFVFCCSYVYQQQITEQKVVDDGDEIPEKPQMKFQLECNGPIQSRVILQPTSLDSDVHTRMALKLSDKMKRDKKSDFICCHSLSFFLFFSFLCFCRISIRDYETIVENPEKTLQKLIKQEEDEMRKLRRQREQNTDHRSFMINTTRNGPSMTAAYLNDDSQYDGDNLDDLKSQRKPSSSYDARKRRNDEDEEEEEDEEVDNGKGRFSPEPSDDEGESLGAADSFSEDEEEDDDSIIVADDEDEEEEGEGEGNDEESGEEAAKEGDEEEEEKPARKEKNEKKMRKKAARKERKREKKEKRKKEKESAKRKRKQEVDLKEDDEEEDDDQVAHKVERKEVSEKSELAAEDEDDDLNIPQRKKAKRAFVDSDEEEL
jgi:hypothetical protein